MPPAGKRKRAELDLATSSSYSPVSRCWLGHCFRTRIRLAAVDVRHHRSWCRPARRLPRLEQSIGAARRLTANRPVIAGGCPFVRGLIATFCFFLGNISFYFLVPLFMQTAMGLSALDAGFVMVPVDLGVRHCGATRRRRAGLTGIGVLIKGFPCRPRGSRALLFRRMIDAPSMFSLMVPLTLFGYGRGLVMAQLFSAVLRSVAHSRAGSASAFWSSNRSRRTGVAVVGAIFSARERPLTARCIDCGADHADHRGGPVCRGAGMASPLSVTRRGVGSTHYCDIAAPGRVRRHVRSSGEDRHRIPGASVGQPTEPCLGRGGPWRACARSHRRFRWRAVQRVRSRGALRVDRRSIGMGEPPGFSLVIAILLTSLN